MEYMIDKETIMVIALVTLLGALFIAYQWYEDKNQF